MKAKYLWVGALMLALLLPGYCWAQGIPMINVTGSGKDAQYSLSLQLLALMTTLTLLPSLLLMMTSFVRIIIVMSILRQALGTGQTPPNNVLVGISLFLTLFIMSPVLTDIYTNAAVPYMENGMKFDKALAAAEAPTPHGHVYTLHAELEGMKLLPVFERLLGSWNNQGIDLVGTDTIAAVLDRELLPRHQVHWKEVPGRSGVLATQGPRHMP